MISRLGILAVVLGAGWGCTREQVLRAPDSRPQRGGPSARSVASLRAPPAPTVPIARAESIYLRGQFDSARALWQDALTQSRAAQDSAQQGSILTWLGLVAYRQGDYSQARLLGEQALDLKLRTGSSADLSRSYNALGLLAWNEGRLADASSLFGQAAGSASASMDEAGVAKAANNLALVHTELGDFVKARAGFLEARRSGRRLGDARIEGGALTNLGMLDVQMGDPRSAIASLRAARALYWSIGYETGEQNALGQLATAYDAIGEPRLAFATLDSALELSRKEGLRQEEASNLDLIAGLHRQAGDFHRALQIHGRASRLNRELGLAVEEGAGLRSEAEIHSVLGRPDLARDYAGRALRIHQAAGARSEELRDHLLLAELASISGTTSAIAIHLGAARRLATGLDARTARVVVALAEAAIRDRAGGGRDVLRVLGAAREDLSSGDYGAAWQAAALRARAYERLSLLDSAAAAGTQAVAAVEHVRRNFGSGLLRTSYAADKAAAYADLVGVLLRLGRTEEAFEVADASRSRALLEHLGAPRAGVPLREATIRAFAENEQLLRRIDTLVSRLNVLEEVPPRDRDVATQTQARALATELTAARGAYESLLVQVAERDGAGAALLGGRRVGAREVRRALGPDEAIIDYFVTRDGVITFVVTSDAVRSIAIAVPLDDLVRRVRLARDLLGDKESRPDELKAVLGALHGILVAPAERAGMLRNVRRLIIVPHSVLAYLPFAALQAESTGRYLIQDHVLLYLPSAAALGALRTRSSSLPGRAADESRAVAFAPFTRTLPASRQEVRAFTRAVPGAVRHEGASATEVRLREALSGGGIVHLATHGVMNLRNPMFSRMELARTTESPDNDGRLEIHEVLEMRIHAPLVFLSGCETGVGAAWSTQFARGEDYATLAQAFLYAGAGSVIATLWRIGDEGAAGFAERFYAQLPAKGAAEAVAATQRELLQSSRYTAPYYWAAYQTSGDGQRVQAHIAPRVSVQPESDGRPFTGRIRDHLQPSAPSQASARGL